MAFWSDQRERKNEVRKHGTADSLTRSGAQGNAQL